MGGGHQIKGRFRMKTQKNIVFSVLIAVLPNMRIIYDTLCRNKEQRVADKYAINCRINYFMRKIYVIYRTLGAIFLEIISRKKQLAHDRKVV